MRTVISLLQVNMHSPARAIVSCVDEKSRIQALDRTQPGMPLKKGRCGTMTHDYKGNGTTTLLAALNAPEGKLIGACMPRHRHQEFVKFLRLMDGQTPADVALHLIVDNYAMHKHPKVKSSLERHKRFHLHFTPTSSSWLNLVERWFREITDKRIRRLVFHGVKELVAAIDDYVAAHNEEPRSFTGPPRPRPSWKKSAATGPSSIRCKQREELQWLWGLPVRAPPRLGSFPVQVLSEPAVIRCNGLFLTGSLSDAEAVPSWRFRGGISVRDVPADALDLGEFELWNPSFWMLVHRSNLGYDAVA